MKSDEPRDQWPVPVDHEAAVKLPGCLTLMTDPGGAMTALIRFGDPHNGGFVLTRRIEPAGVQVNERGETISYDLAAEPSFESRHAPIFEPRKS